jgi:cytochrome bd-type quinol oxidase subunit 2
MTGERTDDRAQKRMATPARALLAVYVLFVIAAGGRSSVQLAMHAADAPLAYGLSAGAAAVYLCGAVLMFLADRDRKWLSLVIISCSVELAGVVVVGTLSLAAPALFPDSTVWSTFGAGYGFVPLALPLAGLAWAVWSVRRGDRSDQPADEYWMSIESRSKPRE